MSETPEMTPMDEIVLNLPDQLEDPKEDALATAKAHGVERILFGFRELADRIDRRLDDLGPNETRGEKYAVQDDHDRLFDEIEKRSRKLEAHLDAQIEGLGDSLRDQMATTIDGIVQDVAKVAGEVSEVLSRLKTEPPSEDDAERDRKTEAVPETEMPAIETPPRETMPASANRDVEWQRVMLGQDLLDDDSLAEARKQLLNDLLDGDDAANALVGQLMLARAATPDRLVLILKEVGEAYYQWRPRNTLNDDPLEEFLVTFLTRCVESSGLRNTIQLVRPGDRFDNSRHNASERGVEVATVRGWVVLRDNGKVYTKASVSVK